MTIMNILSAQSSTIDDNIDDSELNVICADYSNDIQEFNAATNQLSAASGKLDDAGDILCGLVGRSSLTEDGALQLALSTNNLLKNTDAEVTHVIPAMESNEEYDVVLAAEGFREVITKLWGYLKAGKDRLIKALKKLIKSILGRVVRCLRTGKALQKRVENTQGKVAKEPKVKVTSGTKSFMVEGKTVKDYNKISEHFTELVMLTTYFNDPYFDVLKTYGKKLAKAVEDADTTSPEAALTSVLDAAQTGITAITLSFDKECRIRTKELEQADRVISRDKGTVAACHLLGDKSLVKIVPTAASTSDVMQRSEVMRKPVFEMYQTRKKEVDAPKDIEMPVLTLDQAGELASVIITTCEALKRNIDKDRVTDLEKTAKDITRAGDKFVAAAKKEESVSPSDTARLNAIPNHIAKFETWISTPAVNLEAQFIAVANALMGFANKSLSEYK